MPVHHAIALILSALIPVSLVAQERCSTEKVNHKNCTLTIDRRFPVVLPTIQMKQGTKIDVVVLNPLPFETLTLDVTSATLLPGTDQGASLVTASLPDLKGLTWWTSLAPTGAGPQGGQEVVDPIAKKINDLRMQITNANSGLSKISGVSYHITTVYGQLSQILSPIPRPLHNASSSVLPPPLVAFGTPSPWDEYGRWRNWMLCELEDTGCEIDANPDPSKAPQKPSDPPYPAGPAFTNVLGEIGGIQSRLPTTPPAAPPSNAFFDQGAFDKLATSVKQDIGALPPDQQNQYLTQLNPVLQSESKLTTTLALLGNFLTNVQKDFLNYDANIHLATGRLPEMVATAEPVDIPGSFDLGMIYDPRDTTGKLATPYPKFFGRQVVFSINAVNQISTSRASVTASAAKASIATITVLYADPIFETSAGAIFSFVHNRAFSNQTVAATSAQAGDIVIYESKTRPEVVPIVAAHVRAFNDFTVAHRRSAFYGSAFVGLNPYSTLPEYGAGPTFSWRSLMVSALYDRTHDTRLTAGESVGQVVCSPTAATGATPPPCTPAPPAPTTKTFSTNAFGFALTVRIPTSFASGTGGVSR